MFANDKTEINQIVDYIHIIIIYILIIKYDTIRFAP